MRIVVAVARSSPSLGEGVPSLRKPPVRRFLSHLVDSGAYYRVGQPGELRSLASWGLADAGAHDVAHDHLIDLLRGKTGACDGALDCNCTEFWGGERTQCTVELSEGVGRV